MLMVGIYVRRPVALPENDARSDISGLVSLRKTASNGSSDNRSKGDIASSTGGHGNGCNSDRRPKSHGEKTPANAGGNLQG